MRRHLDLDPHVVLPQSRHTNTSPDRLMIGHVLPEVADHGLEGFTVDGDMVRVDTEDLFPALSARVLEVQFHVGKRLVDLGVDFLVEFSGLGIPAACIE